MKEETKKRPQSEIGEANERTSAERASGRGRPRRPSVRLFPFASFFRHSRPSVRPFLSLVWDRLDLSCEAIGGSEEGDRMTGNLLPTLRKFSFVSPSLVNIIELGLRKRRGGHARTPRTRHHFLVESKTACSQRRLCSASPIFHFSSFILQYVLKSSFKCLETPD